MVEITALWIPIVVSAVFVMITLVIVHMLPGWHKTDMAAIRGEDRVLETLRGANLTPGEYRFPFGATTEEMTSPAFVEKMKAGPVGTMTIRPNGELAMGKMMGLWFVYSLVIGAIVACVTGSVHARGALLRDVFVLSSIIAFCCYVMAHWQNWIWWGRSTRYTLTYSVDGLVYALVTGATFGWLWHR